MEIPMTNTINGRMILERDKPLDFKAVNSLFSEKFPKVIKEEINMDNGNASGIRLADT
jgi:hypothetical protein